MPSLILPVLVQVALTLFLLLRVALTRTAESAKDRSLIARSATDSSVWPDRARQVANCYTNQLESPVLFYVVIIFYLITGGADPIMAWLAWAFVFFRIIHMLIHTTYNRVLHRFIVFAMGTFVLLAMWVFFAWHYFT